MADSENRASLHVGHTGALLACVLVVAGALGPWVSGRDFYVFESEKKPIETSYGFEGPGWIFVALAVAAGASLLLLREPNLRSGVAALALAANVGVAWWLWGWTGFMLQDKTLHWGLPLVIAASAVGIVGVAWGRVGRARKDGSPGP